MSNPTIMVVDDSSENLHFMETVLKSASYQVRLAPKGKLALRAIALKAPDLVLLDINMPDMDGYEVCRKIRENEALKSLPVLFVSGTTEGNEDEQVHLVGGTALIARPFGIQTLLKKIESLLVIQ